MNRQDAIALMKQGVKMTHDFFDYDEWLVINEDGMYLDESWFLIPEEIYWTEYMMDEVEEGWYRWEGPEEEEGKKTTAVEDLIDYFSQQLKAQRESSIKHTGEEAFADALFICKNVYRTIEKKQIIDAWLDGGKMLSCKNAEEYYTKTYGDKISR